MTKGTILRIALATVAVAAFGATAFIAVRPDKLPWRSTTPEPVAAVNPSGGDGYGERGDLFVVTEDNRLMRLGERGLDVPVTGLSGGERIVGIDTRPANGQLYAVGSSSRLYALDPATGAAGAIGPVFATALSGTRFGVDFNPAADKLRIVSDTGQNLRIDPTTGAVAGVDQALSSPGITAAGYAGNATLYDLDSTADRLVVQDPPNSGRLTPVGPLGMDVTGMDGFDIMGNAAVAAVRVKGAPESRLVRINLRTGKATMRGTLPVGVTGIAASAGQPRTVYAVTARNDFVVFDRATLRIRSQNPITGLSPGEQVTGLDVRPANGVPYLLTSANQIYTLDPRTSTVTRIGLPFSAAAYGRGIGFDVNPAADRLRVLTANGDNLRLVPETAAVAGTDKPLRYAPGDPNAQAAPRVVHAAYANNRAGTTTTTLYDLDITADALLVQSPPNDGALRTTGPLNLNATTAGGFDIAPDGVAIAALSRGQGTRLYTIDLTTGRADSLGRLGRGSTLTALTAAPRGV
ncbi:DUF4394 domain-containing protein [Paractinoplanes rishiriensis]|uniref:DUF4394 domain-containing protein n=1 Tax=Paractinoplanes rishiriensis TaxID=1050105 RepID=A0A919JXW5_9ACTN|nr:DUF4394 domain-containing protein [Actinoplanes rishiriensis]GIE95254.1 hypothetical protein Ari01nite_27190 [Actinoplanes rishiriensis]